MKNFMMKRKFYKRSSVEQNIRQSQLHAKRVKRILVLSNINKASGQKKFFFALLLLCFHSSQKADTRF